MKSTMPKKVIVLSLLLALIFPAIIYFVLSPAIDKVVFSETTDEANRLGDHIIDSYEFERSIQDEGSITGKMARDLVLIQKEFKLHKINILSADNKVVFSTNNTELGSSLRSPDVFDELRKGKRRSFYLKKGDLSAEGVPVDIDVVEAYIPIIHGNTFLGVVEIYYDISKASDEFRALKFFFGSGLFLVAFILVIVVALYARRAQESESRHKEAKEELVREQLKSEAIFTAMGDNVIVQDREYKVIYQNQVNRERYGDTIGEYCYDAYEKIDHVCEDCPVEQTYHDGEVHHAEKVVQTDNGTMYVELTSCPMKNQRGDIVAGIKIVRDITGRKVLEEQLRHAQKMEAIGTLTSGISHEFNNILAAVLGFAEILKDELKESDPLKKYADMIYESTLRASNLTKSLLAYSRRQITNMQPVMINDFVVRAHEFISGIVGVDIKLELDLAEEDMPVMIDLDQMQQVLVNLAANARDVMPEGGRLLIRTEPYTMKRDFLISRGFGKPGDYVLISVSDTGKGMDDLTRTKIFEPFFTTKEVGRGTGLGLSIVYGIVKNHSGFIEVESTPGGGSTFLIYLPVFHIPES